MSDDQNKPSVPVRPGIPRPGVPAGAAPRPGQISGQMPGQMPAQVAGVMGSAPRPPVPATPPVAPVTEGPDDHNDIQTELETIDQILMEAVERNASDVILTAYTEPSLKIYGKVQRLSQYGALSVDDIDRLIREIITEETKEELERKRQLDFSIDAAGYRWRVNIAGQRHSFFLTLRIIPTTIKTLEDLKLPIKLTEICMRPRGLVLVTGPTGSGKSTSLAAMINYINRNMARHIVTIEDPIEFMHENMSSIINQREIGVDATSFKEALRAVLRQAPDIILVGELRDHETMEAAISAAETGHLVMATLHTNSAVGTIDRIVDAFPEGARNQIRVQLANNLICVMSQTLVPRADNKGRVLAYELMLQHTAISAAIREGKTGGIYDTINQNESIGMMSLDKMLLRLVRDRVVTAQTATTLSIDKAEFEEALKKAGLK